MSSVSETEFLADVSLRSRLCHRWSIYLLVAQVGTYIFLTGCVLRCIDGKELNSNLFCPSIQTKDLTFGSGVAPTLYRKLYCNADYVVEEI